MASTDFMKNYKLGSAGLKVNSEIDPTFNSSSSSSSSAIGSTYGASLLSDGLPKIGGDWMDTGKFGLDVAKTGLGIYSALEQSSLNDFMKGYYTDQMAMQKTDFSNNATSTNAALEGKQRTILSAQGVRNNSDAMTTGVNDYMKKWGATTTY